jgi:hypothetical protein
MGGEIAGPAVGCKDLLYLVTGYIEGHDLCGPLDSDDAVPALVPRGGTRLRRANRPFMTRGWRGLFDILPGEGRVVSLLIAHSLFMGISLIVFETAAIALFLARFPAESVPYTFIGTAFVVPVSGVVYNSLRNRLSTPRLWAGTLLFLLAVPLAAVGVLHATRSAWPSFVLMVLVIAMYSLTALEFWSLAGRVLSLRQARGCSRQLPKTATFC